MAQLKNTMSEKLKKAIAGLELKPGNLPPRPLKQFSELTPGDLIVITYPPASGRTPGSVSAQVITVSNDGLYLHARGLHKEKPPQALTLKQVKTKFTDVEKGREVTIAFPASADIPDLKELVRCVGLHSPDMDPLVVGEIGLFVYPPVTSDDDEWVPGTMLASVAWVAHKPDKDGDLLYRVIEYKPGYLKPGYEELASRAIEELSLRRRPSGHWHDDTYKVDLTVVRRATPGEVKVFEADRNTVAELRALPKAPLPEKAPPKKKGLKLRKHGKPPGEK